MNIQRGLLRLWIVLAVTWGVVVVIIAWANFSDPYLPPKYWIILKGELFALERDPGYDVRRKEISFAHGNYLIVDKDAEEKKVRLQAAPLIEKAFDRSPEIWDKRREQVLPLLGFLALPPLVLLGAGAALLWALSGFRRDA